jgi:hypothetical protein
MRELTRTALLLLMLSATIIIASCAPLGVEVWQRDVLAEPQMQLNYESIDRAFDDHIYFSKEGSSGGRGFAGGGCGCN